MTTKTSAAGTPRSQKRPAGTPRAEMGPVATPLSVVHATLQSYAQRGVFGAFHQDGLRFRFTWLWNLPFQLQFDPRRRTLTFPDLFPKAAPIESELRRFIRDCCSQQRPEHRRVDSKRMKVTCVRRQGSISLVCQVKGADYEYGVKKAVNLVSEVFLSFLNVEHHPYLVEHFQRPED
jgi:hypothetical protein